MTVLRVVIAFACFFSLSSVVRADSAAPTISSLTVSPSTLNMDTGGDRLVFSYELVDGGGSGLNYIRFRLTGPGGILQNSDFIRFSGAASAVGTFDFVLPDYLPAGEYTIQTTLQDVAGNFAAVEADGLSTPASVTIVNSNGDSTPPTINSLTISPTRLEMDGTIDGTFVAAYDLADSGSSGLGSFRIQLRHQTTRQTYLGPLRLLNGVAAASGNYLIDIPAAGASGNYDTEVTLWDRAGNRLATNGTGLTTPNSVEVSNSGSDTSPPVVNSLTPVAGTIAVSPGQSSSLTINYDVEDVGPSGLYVIQMKLRGRDGGPSYLGPHVFLNGHAAAQGSYQIPIPADPSLEEYDILLTLQDVARNYAFVDTPGQPTPSTVTLVANTAPDAVDDTYSEEPGAGFEGTPFVFNTVQVNVQRAPRLALLANRRAVATWHDESGVGTDTSPGSIRARVYDLSGTSNAPDFIVNSTTSNNQWVPDIATLANGEFVIVWQDNSQTGGDTQNGAIRGQRFDQDGQRIGAELLINAVTVDNQSVPRVTGLQGGGFAVVWQDESDRDYQVSLRIFDSGGNPITSDIRVNPGTRGTGPMVEQAGDGNIIVGWYENSGVSAQWFSAGGALIGSKFELLPPLPTDPFIFQMSPIGASQIAVLRSNPVDSLARVFNSAGTLPESSFTIDTLTRLWGTENGNIIVLRDVRGAPARIDFFAPDGNLLASSEIDAIDSQGERDGDWAFLNSGEVFGVWQSADNDIYAELSAIPPLLGDSGHTLPVLANDTDADNDTLTITAINGEAVIAAAGAGHAGITSNSVTLPSGAGAALAEGGIVYDPTTAAFATALPAGATGNDTFAYTISDGALTDTANVTVTVTGVNDPPFLTQSLGMTVDEDDGPKWLNQEFEPKVSDPDTGDTVSLASFDASNTVGHVYQTENCGFTPTRPCLFYDDNGQFETLALGQSATDSVDLLFEDQAGARLRVTLGFGIRGANDAPVAADDALATTNTVSLDANLFADNGSGADSDIDTGDGFSVTAVNSVASNVGSQITLPSGALLTVSGNGTVNYDPNGAFDLTPGATTQDSFTYTIADSAGATSIATVTITITGNTPPDAVDDVFSVHPTQSFVFGSNLALNSVSSSNSPPLIALSNDRFAQFRQSNYRLFLTILNGNNEVIIAERELSFSPSRQFSSWLGIGLGSSEVILFMTSAQSGDFLHDPDVPSIISGVVINTDNAVAGQEITFREHPYTDDNGRIGGVQAARLEGGEIALHSTYSESRGPVSVNLDLIVNSSVIQTSTRNCVPHLGICPATLVSNGRFALSLVAQRNISPLVPQFHVHGFLNNEVRTFDYLPQIECSPVGGGGQLDAQGRLVALVGRNCLGINLRPLPSEFEQCAQECWVRLNGNEFELLGPPNMPILAQQAVPLNVIANDTDPDNDPLMITAVNGTPISAAGLPAEWRVPLAAPASGPVTLPSGSVVSLGDGVLDFDPRAAGFAIALPDGVTGDDTFTYTISDGAATDTANVTVTLTGVNDAPSADADALTANEDDAATDVTATLLDGDTDPDTGETAQLSVSAIDTAGTQGLAALNAGVVTYTPNGAFEALAVGQTANDSFGYTVSDPGGLTASATVSVTVEGENDSPVADADALTFGEEEAARDVTATLLDGDGDPDNGETAQLAITAVDTTLTLGRVTLTNGVVTYDPNGVFNALAQGQTANDRFDYTISDPHGATATATATLTINGFNGYQLTVSTSGLGAGTVTSLPLGINCGGGGGCTALFTQNSEVALSALVAPGTTFEGWGGECLDPAQPLCVVRMTGNRSVSARFSLTTVPEGRIVAATLPGARSGYVGGNDITVFMSVLSRATTPAQACRVTAPNDAPFTLTYRQINAQNEVVGAANPLFDLANGGGINFVVALTPTQTTPAAGYIFLPQIACENADLAPIEGVNSVLVSIGAAPVPDILSIGATPSADGVVRIPPTGNRINFLSAAAVNIGAGDGSAGANEATVTASVDTGAASLPVTLEVCETASTGGCITPRGETAVTTVFAQNVVKFFAVFVRANGEETVPFSPANSRVFLRFADASGAIRSVTSAAISAPAPANDPAEAASLTGRWSVLVRQPSGDWPSLRRASLFVLEDGTAILDDGASVTTLMFEHLAAENEITRFELSGYQGFTREATIQSGDALSDEPGALWGVRDARSDTLATWSDMAGDYGSLHIGSDGAISGTLAGCIVHGAPQEQTGSAGLMAANVTLTACNASGRYTAVIDQPANDNDVAALLIGGASGGWRVPATH